MRIALGSDHAGFSLKEYVRGYLTGQGHDVVDVGTYNEESCDYPDFGAAVGRLVASAEVDKGVVVCGSGLGITIAANKVAGVRAVQVMDPEMAEMARRHNDANVVGLAGRYIGIARAESILDVFLATEFEGGRHQRRVDKITALENERQ